MHIPLRPNPTDAMLPISRAAAFAEGAAVGPGSIADEAGLRIGLLPEEHEGPARQVLEERIVGRAERRTFGNDGRALRGARRGQAQQGEDEREPASRSRDR